MYVEACTKALIKQILLTIDRPKEGLTIDIGLGTHDFYCEFFNSLNYKTIAVEPLPTEEADQICQTNNIPLIQSCISDVDGQVLMYIGNRNDSEDYNLNSMRANWWGASEQAIEVSSMSLLTLLNQVNSPKVTCLKIDVEGMEWVIIKQLQDLPKHWLPSVLIFEYGGGGTQAEQQGGWTPEIIQETLDSLEIIKNLGYRQAILIDLASDLKEQILDLVNIKLETAAIFPPQSIYGNIIILREGDYSPQKIAATCQPYYSNQQPKGKLQQLLKKFF